MADTGNKVVTISQAARYLGKDVSGGIGDSVITLRQLRAMRDGIKATPTVLPSGYTELEYIQSSGTQYIDTGFKPNQDTRVTAKMDGYNAGTPQWYFGSRDGTNSKAYGMLSTGGRFRDDFGTDTIAFDAGPGALEIDKNKGKTYISGELKASHPSATFQGSNSMFIFGMHQNGTNDSFAIDDVRFYYFNVYDNGTQVRGFVPAKRDSDGAVGMYDTIGGQFYANDGTGSFMAGPVVPHSADPRDGLVVRVSQLARIEIGPTIVSWSTGTDEEIVAMVKAADAGIINLSDYWASEETRTVRLSAMPGSVSNANESHAAQDVQFVLTDPGHYTLANGNPCNFVVLQKDCLAETGMMNSQNTNSGGWNNCPRRTWCNSVYRNAIPSPLRGIFKQFTTYAAHGAGESFVASRDYFALFSEKEVFGRVTYANSSAESKNSQLTWFKTSSNRIKRVRGGARYWWERSPYSGNSRGFCLVTQIGSVDCGNAYNSYGLAPFGCI